MNFNYNTEDREVLIRRLTWTVTAYFYDVGKSKITVTDETVTVSEDTETPRPLLSAC